LVQVTGIATYEGKPLGRGLIQFMPAVGGPGKRSSVGIIDSSGRYNMSTFNTADGVRPGEYLVSIDGAMDTGEVAKPINLGDENAVITPSKSAIPAKYASIQTSGLKVAIPEDATQLNLDFALVP
jgi:hypothetical protein